MENKERAQLEVQHQKKLESLKKEVAMLTKKRHIYNLLNQHIP
jgi:hypothetical protein